MTVYVDFFARLAMCVAFGAAAGFGLTVGVYLATRVFPIETSVRVAPLKVVHQRPQEEQP
ncbi:MAG: hypothetical protein HZC55_04180 [Verrucomicrobia bacterium]|nr:hypothetical protein [Verrucomicrobiota bacterium]